MGLYYELNIAKDLGYPSELSFYDEEIGEAFVLVDYSGAVEAFISTFLQVANELVPVRTGYLRSTITANTDGEEEIYCEATADYAQYVEYGTSYMEAQPYFEPAIEAALFEAILEAELAVLEAQEELESMLAGLMDSAMGIAGGGRSFGSFLFGLGIFMLMAIILFPILVNIYGIIDSLKYTNDGGGEGLPEVIIT